MLTPRVPRGAIPAVLLAAALVLGVSASSTTASLATAAPPATGPAAVPAAAGLTPAGLSPAALSPGAHPLAELSPGSPPLGVLPSAVSAAAGLASAGAATEVGTPPEGGAWKRARRPTQICESEGHPEWAADLSRKIVEALRGRLSVVGIAADDPDEGITCAYHQWVEFHAASVVKVITLGALLYQLQATHTTISSYQDALAHSMIIDSDNGAADALWNEVGMTSLQQFVSAAGMGHTVLGQDDLWGLTQVNPHDELRLLHLFIDHTPVLNAASRSYALRLMAEVTPSQVWGVPAGAAPGTTVHLKNGWLPDPDQWDINSIGDFTRHGGDYSIVVLTRDNPDMEYGVSTIEAIARQINAALAGS